MTFQSQYIFTGCKVNDESNIAWLYEQTALGDKRAENELIITIIPRLRNHLQRYVWEKSALDDVLQEVLIACLIKARQRAVKSPESFMGYALAIGKNLAFRYIKNQKQDYDIIAFNEWQEQVSNPDNASNNPDVKIETIEIRRFMLHMLERLPQKRDQQILVSYYFREDHSKDICYQHNLHKDHLYRVLSRARKRLGRLISQQSQRHELSISQ